MGYGHLLLRLGGRVSWQIRLLQFIRPMVRWFGRLHLPFTVKKVNGKHFFNIEKLLEPGDIILSITHGQLSNLVNPADWNHAAMYCGEHRGGQIKYVLEATGRGVIKTDLITHILSKDEIAVIKPSFLTHYKRRKIKDEAIDQYEGMDYDFLFIPGANKLYCYELCVEILNTYCPAVLFSMYDSFMGHKFYSEKTFINNTDDFELVFNTRGK